MKKNILALILVVCFVLGACPTAFAATTNDPYGFTYEDAAAGRTVYSYYTYDSREDSYIIGRTFYSIGNTIYTEGGMVITNVSAGSGARYNGFSVKGDFYYITSAGALISVNSSGKQTTWYSSGAKLLMYNNDDLANVVQTTSGNKYLSDFSSAPGTGTTPVTPVTPPSESKVSYVETYTNSSGEFVRDAYELGKLKVSIITSKNGKNVLNATDGVRLSDTLKGAKFLGFDTNFSVYLYETNGTLYRFKFGNWYSAERINLDSNFKTVRLDEQGFISTVVTEKSSYTIAQLTDTTDNKWIAKKTYAVSKGSYTTLYTKDSAESNTLLLKDGSLSLNGVIVASRIVSGSTAQDVTDFGFISDKEFCYIRGGYLYISSIYTNPSTGYTYSTNVASLLTNDVGLVSKAVLNNGTKLNIK